MIDLYTWSTPNGRKVSIMLEELGLEYEVHKIDITKGDQHKPEFLAISPNNKIPAIRDRDNGYAMMESAAIMLYLAEKCGKLMPAEPMARHDVMQWLMMQMGSVGPMLGQTHHFLRFNKGKAPYAEERYGKENARIYKVLDTRLSDHEWLAGDYSVADIATWPWISRFEWQDMDLGAYPDLRRWYLAIAERPATGRGYDVPSIGAAIPMP
ncbi:MAG: glutathione S-transferase N-terminal domain-containing protein [Alphaproteobacteria bacterium]|jgi:GST-like protein|nr:glutathione S-transferase N-terminal domain-containing protein [Alphaproteobacteria bacterium]MDP6517171.1 glutathione S-transferase N-terminal domain-containing protein [Alphaproteobacteria bacterium]|tara:strand:+ start:211 stop:840 length:630 start_codon:yes stop_codon:yes gene_type:complete